MTMEGHRSLGRPEEGHEAVAQLLLEHKADVDAMDCSGRMSLLLAVEEGHKAVVRLLEHKADAQRHFRVCVTALPTQCGNGRPRSNTKAGKINH
jgi:hypothetical protein